MYLILFSYSVQIQLMLQNTTRTTRMPAFWGYKTRQSPSYNLKEFAKTINFWILNKTLHATHLLELLDKRGIWNGSGNIVEDTKQTQFCTQTDKVKPVYPFQLLWAGGIIMFWWLSGKTNAITPITHWPCYAIGQQKFCVNIGSGNGLLLDGTKPLPQPMLTDHQWSPVKFIFFCIIKSSEIHIRPIPQEASTINH